MYNLENDFVKKNLYVYCPKEGDPIYAVLIPIDQEHLDILNDLRFRVVFLVSSEDKYVSMLDEIKWIKHGYISMPETIEMYHGFDGSIKTRIESCELPFRHGDFAAVDLSRKNGYEFVTSYTKERMWRKVESMTMPIEEFLEKLEENW